MHYTDKELIEIEAKMEVYEEILNLLEGRKRIMKAVKAPIYQEGVEVHKAPRKLLGRIERN